MLKRRIDLVCKSSVYELPCVRSFLFRGRPLGSVGSCVYVVVTDLGGRVTGLELAACLCGVLPSRVYFSM